jgi:hypothetical protein
VTTERTTTPAHHLALLRHFADLRDGTHGENAVRRADKERLFAAAVALLEPVARRVLDEMNRDLLLGGGTVAATGMVSRPDGGVEARWTLSWPQQREAHVQPLTIHAHYGRNFHHPHLSGGTVGHWPLNVFDAEQAEAELPTLRAIAAADLHNLVFEADYRIVPATAGAPEPPRSRPESG